MDKDIYFWRVNEPYGYFSQWYKSEFVDNYDIKYNCAEQYMMYKKALLFKDFEVADKILKETEPKNIKALGRKIKNFDDLTWNDFKFDIVKDGNFFKFSQNEDLKKKLLATSDAFIAEASPFDRIWGIGIDVAAVKAGVTWQGENLLGKAIMQVRNKLKED